ncbi:hypothetical protein B0T24DRAFT_705550 [Lasiosphaeria ovina]|uniref:Uncharacterized protein n=1 Tax=Lasiosphaeria ovina TaxID=92902 RepID=A0AAE0K6D7_9PEZI|nr:hypothetical protein B0T24DRAFT_705550 [Lasiosphaeria ovina]
MAHRDRRLCPEWVISNFSDVDVAKDRGWFVEYRPYSSFIHCGRRKEVIGIGTVELPVMMSWHEGTGLSQGHGTLRLEYVLHCPDSLCNTIGSNIYSGMRSHDGGTSGVLLDRDERVMACYTTKPHIKHWWTVVLRNPPDGYFFGSSAFRSTDVSVDTSWPLDEREKFELSLEPQDRENYLAYLGAEKVEEETATLSNDATIRETDHHTDDENQNDGQEQAQDEGEDEEMGGISAHVSQPDSAPSQPAVSQPPGHSSGSS